jgi:transcriptional regulator with XRE-family HTH domain
MDKPDTEFRAWRRRLNIPSQEEAAGMIGRSRRQVAAYEGGAQIPRVVRLAMLALEHLPYNVLYERPLEAELQAEADKLEQMR